MKKQITVWLMILAVIVSGSLMSCQKLDEVDLVDPNVDNEGIVLKTAAGEVVGDTLITAVYLNNALRVVTTFISDSIQVTFSTGGSAVVNSQGYFSHAWVYTGLSTMTVTVWDQNSQIHTKVYYVKTLVSFVDPFQVISFVPNGANYNIVMAASKSGMALGSRNFGYTGSGAITGWVNTIIADTNYRLENGALIAIPVGSGVGQWIAVHLTIPVGDYQMGVGKFQSNTSTTNLDWGSFLGSPFASPNNSTLLEFTVTPNGVYTVGGTPSSLPGEIGDEYVRFTQNQNGSWNMFINNGVAFSTLPSPFVKYLATNELYGTPVNQTAVSNSPNWGMVTISTPLPESIAFQYGNNSANPMAVNANMNQSDFWDGRYGYLWVGFGNLPVSAVRPGESSVIIQTKEMSFN